MTEQVSHPPQEEKFFSILNTIQEGYYEVDLYGHLTFFNDALCNILGYPKEELLNINYKQLAAPEDRKKIFNTFKQVYLTGEMVDVFEWKLIRKDGSEVFIETSIYPVTEIDGSRTGFRGILRDITGRKKTEEALRQSEENYRHLVENASDVIYINDYKGNFRFMNETGLKKLGYTLDEIKTINYADLLPEEYRESEMNFYKTQIRSRSDNITREIPVLSRDSKIIWVAPHTRVVRQAGMEVEFYSIARDITELRKIQNELEESERKYRELVEEKTRDIIITTDPEGFILTANKNFQKKLGYSEKVLNEMNIRELIYDDPDDRENINLAAFNEHLDKVIERAAFDVRFKTVCRHNLAGEPVTLQFKLDPILSDDKIRGVMGFASEPSDDPLRQYMTSIQSSYSIPNSLTVAEEVSYRLTRDISQYSDVAPQGAIRMGLREMIINAIEHGNLEISFNEKSRAQESETYFELIRERQAVFEFRNRKVYVNFHLNSEGVSYVIKDEGYGFDYSKFTEKDNDNVEGQKLLHGRGIKLTISIFDEVVYTPPGNEVKLVKYFL